MTAAQLALILLTILGLSIGQVLFKLASAGLIFTPAGLLRSILDPKLIAALFVYFLATGMWLYVLKHLPLRVAYPYVALAFVFVPLLAFFLLHEKLHWNTFVGAAFIGIGVWISSLR
jgi:drug/metabolite transporter (DMT)-like permease